MNIRRISSAVDFKNQIPALAELLVDSVKGGASVGFLESITHDEAIAWWATLMPAIERGETVLLVAETNNQTVGTVQYHLAMRPNSKHRAEVAKLLVHSKARKQGVGLSLMIELERHAKSMGRSLLVLDTETNSGGEHLYRALGYHQSGVIPGYAALPNGDLISTTVMWKNI